MLSSKLFSSPGLGFGTICTRSCTLGMLINSEKTLVRILEIIDSFSYDSNCLSAVIINLQQSLFKENFVVEQYNLNNLDLFYYIK